LVFGCHDDALLGILGIPASDHTNTEHSLTADLAVVVVVGGPQYRAGSHRLFVRLCRQLSMSGVTTLRFDVRGMGDSSGDQRSFEHLSDDIAAAIDAVQHARASIRRIVLWGLCDGASAALLYCHERSDRRVVGLCLLNPWVRSEATLASTHVKHYYLQRLKQPEFWRKLISGQVAGQAARDLWRNLRLANAALTSSPISVANRCAHDVGRGNPLETDMQRPYIERMAIGLRRSRVPTLLVLSGQDFTAREFDGVSGSHPAWKAALDQNRAALSICRLQDADHTLSSAVDAQRLLEDMTQWLRLSVRPSAREANASTAACA